MSSLRGGLSWNEVRDALADRHPSLNRCFSGETSPDGGDLRLSLAIAISPKGDVTDVEVLKSAFHEAYVEDCVLRQVYKWHLPKSDSQQSSSFEFTMTVETELREVSTDLATDESRPAERDSIDPKAPARGVGYRWGGLKELPPSSEGLGADAGSFPGRP